MVEAKLGAGVDGAALAEAFTRDRRLHVPDFLDPAFATQVHAAMAGPVPWTRTMVIGGKGVEAPLQAYHAASGPQKEGIEREIASVARAGFQFCYDTYRLSGALEAGRRLGGAMAPIEAVFDLLNSPAFLSFVVAMTGDTRAAYVDAHVTRFGAGHFLNTHHDGNTNTGRLFAYVLNLTPHWRTDWGGVLLFQDEAGGITGGYPPRFNALNIFQVPQWHSVSQVASFVTAQRHSITGWVRTAPVAALAAGGAGG